MLDAPVPDAPLFDAPVLGDPVLDAPVLDAPVLDAPVLDAPVLDAPATPPDELLSIGVGLVPPGVGELDADEAGVEGLALTDVDALAVTLGLVVLDGVRVEQGVPVGVAAFLLPVALVLAFAEAVVVPVGGGSGGHGRRCCRRASRRGAGAGAGAGTGAGTAAGRAAAGRAAAAGLPLGGLVNGVAGAGVTLGVTGLVDLAAADDEEVDWQAVGFSLLRPAKVRSWLAAPPDECTRLPDPAALPPPLALEEEIPTAEPSWTKASRSGGTAKEIPMANTAQATARAGRSSPYRQSRGCRPAPPVPAPPVPAPPVPAASCSPRMAFQRRIRSARKPRRAEAPECLLA